MISSTHEEAEARHRLGNCNCGFTADEAIKAGCVFDPVSVSWLPSHCRDEELERQFEYEGLVGTDSDKHDGNENDAHHGNEHHGMAHTNHNSSSGMQMATDGHGQAGWSYFADHAPAGLKPTHLSLETVSRMPPGMFFQASRRWHIARCTWVWLKQQRLRDAERHRVLSGRKGGKGARQEGYREKMAASVWRRNGHDEHEPGHASATVIERRFDTEEHVRHCYRIFLERGPLDELIEGYSVSTRADDADDV